MEKEACVADFAGKGKQAKQIVKAKQFGRYGNVRMQVKKARMRWFDPVLLR